MEEKTELKDPDLSRLDVLAKLLDNQFAIPFTNIRFGLDGIVGLVPYVGDMAGLMVSGFLLRTMVRKGAGPFLMLRMLGNYALDTMVGFVPFIGDLFDFGYKANRRNVDLLKKYYAEDRIRPDAKGSMGLLALLFFALMAVLVYLIWKFAALVFSWIFSLL